MKDLTKVNRIFVTAYAKNISKTDSKYKKKFKVQQGKFKQFKAFWNEKEQELKEIDFQLQKVSTLTSPYLSSFYYISNPVRPIIFDLGRGSYQGSAGGG